MNEGRLVHLYIQGKIQSCMLSQDFKENKSKHYVEYKESVAVPEVHMQQCHSNRLGTFLASQKAFQLSEKNLTWKDPREPELLTERYREHSRARAAPLSTGRHCGMEKAPRLSALLDHIFCSPSRAQCSPGCFEQQHWRKLCTVLRLWVEEKNTYLKNRHIINAICDSQSLQCRFLAF